MPEIKVKQIVSFSSEDKVHKAENLLRAETYRKWKCATPGEKKVCAVLQFEKAIQIHSVHIGNEYSAFVEVLVARSSEIEKNFKVLLVASSFMSPLESRNGTNTNRVRMFDSDKLTQNLKDEKWDMVQLICTQPFNKTVQYGLTFVKFQSPPEEVEETESASQGSQSSMSFGSVQLKVQEEEDVMPVGKWFLKQRNSTTNNSSTSPSAIRQASSFAAATLASNRSTLTSPPLSSRSEQGSKRKLDDDDDDKLTFPVKKVENSTTNAARPKAGPADALNHKQSTKAPIPASPKASFSASPKASFSASPKASFSASPKASFSAPPKAAIASPSSQSRVNVKKIENEISNKQPENRNKLSEVMRKVVFVLSGFQNPFRNDLREYALEMGAKYKGDWDPSCTHLVCAFANTPKFNQVKAKGGRIVSKKWVIDCYKKKELLPWRKYMLTKSKDDTSSEEEEEIKDDEDEYIPKPKQLKQKIKVAATNSNKLNGLANEAKAPKVMPTAPKVMATTPKVTPTTPKVTPTTPKVMPTTPKTIPASQPVGTEEDSTDAEVDYQADTDVDKESSGGDTDDELLKAIRLSKQSFKAERETVDGKEKTKAVSPPDTKPDTSSMPLPPLPEFFKKKVFFLYGKFKDQEKHDLQRYITAYNGTIANYMDETVRFVVTLSKWNSDFDEALSEVDSLIFVHPRWIHKCHQMEKLVPYQPHIVVPEED